MDLFKAPRGAPDVLPPVSTLYEEVIARAVKLCRRYGYERIDLPLFEDTSLFSRGVGGQTEIVSKQMYSFEDKGGQSLTLRPEGTAPVVRAVLEHDLHRGALPLRLYYEGAMFRRERPQAGRRRQFSQVGVEAIGSDSPELDAEVIDLAFRILGDTGLVKARLAIGSVGDGNCRPQYLATLVEYLQRHASKLCRDCTERTLSNPLRTFDCKQPNCRTTVAQAPKLIDALCGACADHFKEVRDLLSLVGIPFEIDPMLVRGLDYYTRTTFEVTDASLGAQGALCGGGRYDGLAEELGGDHLPGIGFALGVDRVVIALQSAGVGAREEREEKALVYFVATSKAARRRAFELLTATRARGIAAQMDPGALSVKGQFRAADRSGAKFVVVIGEREMQEGMLTFKDMATGNQESVSEGELTARLGAR